MALELSQSLMMQHYFMQKDKVKNSGTFKKGQIPWNKGRGKVMACLRCGKEKYVVRYRWETFKYCSSACANVKGYRNNTGRTHFIKGMIPHNWKGDEVGYYGLHKWVQGKLGKPSKCEFCGTTESNRYEWANKSGEYKRDLTDWIRLCKHCHNEYDDIYVKIWDSRRANV